MEKNFRVAGPGHRWIPLTKAIDAKLWYFLWSASATGDLRRHRGHYDVIVIFQARWYQKDWVLELSMCTQVYYAYG